jgi:DNA-binding transcriptional ArsR family regulator
MSEQLLLTLSALANSTRLQILRLLSKYDYCVGALARQLDISEAAVSQHLQILKTAGLVEGDKRGYYMHYQVRTERLEQIADELRSAFTTQQGERLIACVNKAKSCSKKCCH